MGDIPTDFCFIMKDQLRESVVEKKGVQAQDIVSWEIDNA